MITFKVSDVQIAKNAKEEKTNKEAIQFKLKKEIEACSDPTSPVIPCNVHPLVYASNMAFDGHRPLIISPDILWVTIAQGIAIHINSNSEDLRKKFVFFDGKQEIIVRDDALIKGSQDNAWSRVLSIFSKYIEEKIGTENYNSFILNFSTTGPVEKTANEIILMDAMQSYFEYTCRTCCGIPEITLEGEAKDYQFIVDTLEKIKDTWKLNWWVDRLIPVMLKIVDSAKGNIDKDFWCSWYKEAGASGGPYIKGHIIKFFPYLLKNTEFVRNTFNDIGFFSGVTTDEFPSGLSQVPFKWEYYEEVFEMLFIAGLIGVEQNKETLALKPKIGWAIMDKEAKKDPNYFKICKTCNKEFLIVDMPYGGDYCDICFCNIPEEEQDSIRDKFHVARMKT